MKTNHEELKMPEKSFSAEQIIAKLRQIEVLVALGKSVAVAWKESEISEQTYYRWRKEYGRLRLDQFKRLTEHSPKRVCDSVFTIDLRNYERN